MNVDERRTLERRYAYCLCLHVKPTTIFFGIVNLGGSLLCAILYLTMLYHSMNSGDDHLDRMSPSQRSTSTSLAIIIYMMLATVSAMLLYGVIKARPSYMIPFFAIQSCDFFFTLPTFVASLYQSPAHYNRMDGISTDMTDIKRLWPNASPNTVYTSSLLVIIMIVLFKGYFLCVVWKCYRFLKIGEMILPLHYHSNVPCMIPEMWVPSMMNIPASVVAPPNYDEATKNNSPPDYHTVVKEDELKVSPATPSSQPQQQQPQQQPQQPPASDTNDTQK